jgi:predicted ATPase
MRSRRCGTRQWADDATLDLLPALAGALDGQPVILICCYRADELPREHRLRLARAGLRRQHRLAEMDVAPLGADDVRRMLASLLRAQPEATLTAAVAGRADGIPFAVEELARSRFVTASGLPTASARSG